eukprot:gnl/Dysnectes_brevis/2908_a3558_1899.p1 GENE.gnl/Dysnectes_brevis/2908_a3558_1899~~gnl/Dysnectes_brevis/2908_a3558_1899.p1  ORF type:complete len:271 (-),score=91.10 gnl/Dysnectes_brevis/2908_a3558_1899:94-906(-)
MDDPRYEIISNLLSQAPSCEVSEVVSDLRTIVNDTEFFDSALLPLSRQINHEKLILIDHPEAGSTVMLSGEAFISDDEETPSLANYLVPSKKQVATVDILSRQVVSVREATEEELGEDVSSARAAFTKYQEDHYPSGQIEVFHAEDGIVALISARRLDLPNFWTGDWRGRWTVQVEGEKAVVTGCIDALAHYYEHGNVQGVLSKRFTGEIAFAGDWSKVIGLVAKMEAGYMKAVMESYESLQVNFKQLRRRLPMFKHKIDWTSATLGKIM